MHSNSTSAQLRLERAIMNFKELEKPSPSPERLAIALSRLVIFTNTIASNIQSMGDHPDSESLNACSDLLWRLGEELRTINPDWFGRDEAR